MAKKAKRAVAQPNAEGMVEVFCRYIMRNGKRVYPRKGTMFHFWAKPRS